MHVFAILAGVLPLASALPSPFSPLFPRQALPDPNSLPSGQFMLCPDVPVGNVMLNQVTVTPNPLTPGQNGSVYAAGTTSTTVQQGAYVTASVAQGMFSFIVQNVDLCTAVGGGCPIQPGPFNLSLQAPVPTYVPPATYVVKIIATNNDGSALACFEGPISVAAAASSTSSTPAATETPPPASAGVPAPSPTGTEAPATSTSTSTAPETPTGTESPASTTSTATTTETPTPTGTESPVASTSTSVTTSTASETPTGTESPVSSTTTSTSTETSTPTTTGGTEAPSPVVTPTSTTSVTTTVPPPTSTGTEATPTEQTGGPTTSTTSVTTTVPPPTGGTEAPASTTSVTTTTTTPILPSPISVGTTPGSIVPTAVRVRV
ncbi:Phosphatidylglycerol/phosphatidylinositol transfer protein [Thoreauomyces humboldtii]|nr:Phosphatidylglycerol/phosphatidylinositol transfer protein [Thoreauomyces humboldtii]